MALTGNLRDFDISNIFQIVAQEGKTGKLVLQGPAGEAFVLFERGRIISAGTGAKDMKKVLMAYLIDIKNAPYSYIIAMAERAKDDIRGLSEQCVVARYVTKQELVHFAKVMLEDLTCDLFLWKDGTYQFDVLDNVDNCRIADVALQTDAITMEAARRVDEWAMLSSTIRPETVYVGTSDTVHGGRFNGTDPLDDGAEYLCSMFDGTLSVDFICKKAFLSSFRIYETILSLIKEEKITALSDKYSTTINEALRRNVKTLKFNITDTITASVITVLIGLLLVCIAVIVPGSMVRQGMRVEQKRIHVLLLDSYAGIKTTIHSCYYHARFGHTPYKLTDLIREGLLMRRDIGFGNAINTADENPSQ